MATASHPVVIVPPQREERDLGFGGVVLLAAGLVGNLVFGSSTLALPALEADLGLTSSTGAVIVALYSVGFAASLVLGGRLGDRYGRRLILRIALIAVVFASALVALAPGVLALCAGRVVQGVASGMLLPQVLSTIQHATTGTVRARWTAVYAAVIGAGTAIGQLSAGLLVGAYPGALGWRLSYAAVAVVASVSLLFSRSIPETRAVEAGRTDLIGAVLLGAAVTGLVLPLGLGEIAVWWARGLMLVAAAAALSAFVLWERGREPLHALMPRAALRSRSLMEGLLLTFLFFAGYGAFVYYFTAAMQQGLEVTALQTALVLLPFAGGFILTSVFVPQMLRRSTSTRLMLYGAGGQALFLGVLGAIMVAGWPRPSFGWVIVALIPLGCAQAMMYGPLIGAVMGSLSRNLAGLASGLFATVQQLGFALGVPVFALIVSHVQPSLAIALCVGAQALLAVLFGVLVVGRRR